MRSLRLPEGQWFLTYLQPLGTDQGKGFNERLCLLYEMLEKAIYYTLHFDKRDKSKFIFLQKKSDESYKQFFIRIDIDVRHYCNSVNISCDQKRFKKKLKQLVKGLPIKKQNELSAWFDSVVGYQNPLLLPLANLQKQGEQNRLSLFDNALLNPTFYHAGYLSGFYKNQDEFQKALETIVKKSIEKKIILPLSFLLRNINHLAAFTYYPITTKYPKEIEWQYYDSNYPGIIDCSLHDIVCSVWKNMAIAQGPMACTIQFFSRGGIDKIRSMVEEVKLLQNYNVKDKTRHEFDSLGGSWLSVAIAAGDYDTVLKLVDEIDIAVIDRFSEKAYKNCSPLLMALYYEHQIGINNDKIIDLLIRKYPQYIDTPALHAEPPYVLNKTPLTQAVERNRLDLVKELVRLGATISKEAFSLAFQGGHIDIARFFLEQIKDFVKEVDWKSLFFNIVKNGHLDIIKLLLEEMKLELLHYHNVDDQSVLSLAAAHGHYLVVKYLLEEKKMDINKINKKCLHTNHYTALDWAIMNGHVHITRYLLEHHAVSQSIGLSFIEAAKEGHVDMIQFLLEQKIEHKTPLLRSVDFSNKTALECAAAEGHYILVKYLYEKETADLPYSRKFRPLCCEKLHNPLDHAIDNDARLVIKYLLEQGEKSLNLFYYLTQLIKMDEFDFIHTLCRFITENENELAVVHAICLNKLTMASFFISQLPLWKDQDPEKIKNVIPLIKSLIDYGQVTVQGVLLFVDPYWNTSFSIEPIRPLLNAILNPSHYGKFVLDEPILQKHQKLKEIYQNYQLLVCSLLPVYETNKKLRIC